MTYEERVKRREEMLALKLRGLTCRAIGTIYGLTRQGAYDILRRPPRFVAPAQKKHWSQAGRDYVRCLVRERDNHTCQECGKVRLDGQRAFDVHHQNGLCGKKSRGYDRIGDIITLITYCHRCHMRYHVSSESKKRRPLKEVPKEDIVNLRAKGLSYDDIAALYGVSQPAIYYKIHTRVRTIDRRATL